MELVIRFILGGLIVSLFAMLGDIFKPKSFAGLFGAAPSVAVASLGLAILMHGKSYAAIGARAMTVGAIPFLIYALWCMRIMAKHIIRTAFVSIASLLVWLACALPGYLLLR